MHIRKFKLSDAISAARLHRNTIRSINSKDYSSKVIKVWSGRTSAKSFRDSADKCFRWVALEKGKIVGFTDISKKGEMWGLYVHKDHLGKGIGRALIKKVEKKAKAMGMKKLKLEATVTAKTFYEKQGYKVLKKTIHVAIHRGERAKINSFIIEKRL